MGPNDCKRCQSRGKPENYGSDPTCAFSNPEHIFNPDNWSCATVDRIREIIYDRLEDKICYSDDSSFIVIGISNVSLKDQGIGDFLLAGWYKQRGKTDTLYIVEQEAIHVPSLKEVEAILDFWENR